MPSPTDLLREEHRVILRALGALEIAAGRLAAGRALPGGWWEGLAAWLRAFADRNHHAKEEQALFPAMLKAGVPGAGGPLEVMLEEHRQGRALVAAMETGAPAARAGHARRYVELLREHIDKENGIVFPLADAVLGHDTLEAIRRDFERVEVEQGADASLEAAEAAVARLERALGGAA